jgi:hypothetical protein
VTVRELEGAPVVSAFGKVAGRIERVYADESGTPRYGLVRWGSVAGRRRMVPLERVHFTREGLHVPYSLHVIHGSPVIPNAGATLDVTQLQAVDQYYAGHVNHR